jgi:hypothetical protein
MTSASDLANRLQEYVSRAAKSGAPYVGSLFILNGDTAAGMSKRWKGPEGRKLVAPPVRAGFAEDRGRSHPTRRFRVVDAGFVDAGRCRTTAGPPGLLATFPVGSPRPYGRGY